MLAILDEQDCLAGSFMPETAILCVCGVIS